MCMVSSSMELDDQRKGEMFSAMPSIHFLPVADYERISSSYACPLYKTSARAGNMK